ncbi:MAG TPA: hypothetical protein VLE48_12910 [Terriglobales bacterium]|nr:hypothetical protein [Terriglobales bacterium]
MIVSLGARKRGQPLYRRRRGGVILLLLALAMIPLAAQRRPKPSERLRALGVLELEKDAGGKARARLVPVTILDHGQYFDAGLYKATPRPMALDPGIVYEAFRSGESAGFFTVGRAVEENRTWFAFGEWEPPDSKPPEKPVVVASRGGEDEGPPRLRRPAGGPSEPQTKSEPVPEPPPDPDRPILKRGKPETQPAEEPMVEFKPAAEVERVAVISDESPADMRPYRFPWNRDEEERLTAAMSKLAEEQVARYLASRPGPKLAPAGPLDAIQVRAFDVNYDNEPELIITARQPARSQAKGKGEQRICYVTVVARSNAYGELRRLFSQVTDSLRLESMPRLELVDAVDSDGDSVGELLFRRAGQTTTSYALYRVTYDSLWLLFEGAASAN